MKPNNFLPIVISAILLLGFINLSHARVLAGPITNPGNGHAYYLLDHTNATMLEAEAEALGGHLATIRDTNENHWVWSTFVPLAATNGVLIGLTDYQKEGTFVWFGGETNGYRNWNAGEPNNSGNEDYVTIRTQDEQWNDISGTDHYGVAEVLVRQTNAVPQLMIQRTIDTTVELSWLTSSNQLYQILSTTSLGASNWSSFGPYQYGDGNTIHLTDTMTNSSCKFYQLVPVK